MPRLFLRSFAAVAVLLFIGQAGFSTSGPRTVTVQPGDSLWGLAYRYHMSIDRLAAANGMQLSSMLLVGRRLQVPAARGPAATTPAAGVTPAGGAGPPAAGPGPAAPGPVSSRFNAAELAQM